MSKISSYVYGKKLANIKGVVNYLLSQKQNDNILLMVLSGSGNYEHKNEEEFKSNLIDDNSDRDNSGFVYFMTPKFEQNKDYLNDDDFINDINGITDHHKSHSVHEKPKQKPDETQEEGSSDLDKGNGTNSDTTKYRSIKIEKLASIMSSLLKNVSNPLLSQKSEFLLEKQYDQFSRLIAYRMREIQLISFYQALRSKYSDRLK